MENCMIEEPTPFWGAYDDEINPDHEVRCSECGANYLEACEENCKGGTA